MATIAMLSALWFPFEIVNGDFHGERRKIRTTASDEFFQAHLGLVYSYSSIKDVGGSVSCVRTVPARQIPSYKMPPRLPFSSSPSTSSLIDFPQITKDLAHAWSSVRPRRWLNLSCPAVLPPPGLPASYHFRRKMLHLPSFVTFKPSHTTR